MYFVDLDQLYERLDYIKQIREIMPDRQHDDPVQKLALERGIHVVIEAILDVGNQIIDGFMMKDPGSYEDIIVVLRDEGVIAEDDAASLVRLVRLRKHLVQEYTEIDRQLLLDTYEQAQRSVRDFPDHVQHYLQTNGDAVTAFIPQGGKRN